MITLPLGYGAGGFFVLSIVAGTLWQLILGGAYRTLRTFGLTVGAIIVGFELFHIYPDLSKIRLLSLFIIVPTLFVFSYLG